MKHSRALQFCLHAMIVLLVIFFQVAIAGCSLLCLQSASDHLADCAVFAGDLLCIEEMASSLVFAFSSGLFAETWCLLCSYKERERIRPPSIFRLPPLIPPETD